MRIGPLFFLKVHLCLLFIFSPEATARFLISFVLFILKALHEPRVIYPGLLPASYLGEPSCPLFLAGQPRETGRRPPGVSEFKRKPLLLEEALVWLVTLRVMIVSRTSRLFLSQQLFGRKDASPGNER